MDLVRLAYKLIRYSGLPLLFREVLFRKGTRIIMFHDPSPEAMERILVHLKRRYTIISLDEFLSGRSLPPRTLVITLDDGHKGNMALAPVFRRHGVRPTIFLCAGLVGTNRHFWFLHNGSWKDTENLKTLPNSERLRILATRGYAPEMEFPERQALTVEEIASMKDYVDLGSHGLLHPCIPFCSGAEAKCEIVGSKELLEQRFGLRVRSFAFPNGDYSERDLELVRQAGYDASLTVDHGFNEPGGDTFRLKRLSVDDSGDLDALSVKVSGVWTLIRVLMGRQRMSRLTGNVDQGIEQEQIAPGRILE